MEKFKGKWNTPLIVILGFIPRIHIKHPSLDTRVKPEYDGRKMMCLKPEYDRKRSLLKGLNVVRQCAALLERRVQSRKAQAVTRQTKHIRNLLPQCASDATGFLSDVYKKSTRARKFLADGVQCGRSMIEMLGVLAIIAVLSVGGIAGYSKAMLMWESNIQKNLITELLHGAIDLKLRFNHQTIPYQNVTSVLAGLGNIPEGVEYKHGTIYTKSGFSSYLSYGLRTMTSRTDGHTYQQNQYVIYFLFNQGGKSLNLSEENFCNNLLQAAKEVADELLGVDFWKTDSTSTSPNGDTGISLYSGKDLKKASITEMRQKCKMVFTETGFAHFNIGLKYD